VKSMASRVERSCALPMSLDRRLSASYRIAYKWQSDVTRHYNGYARLKPFVYRCVVFLLVANLPFHLVAQEAEAESPGFAAPRSAPITSELMSGCGTHHPSVAAEPQDYRNRNNTPYLRGRAEGIERAHLSRAREGLDSNYAQRPVRKNIDFALRHWPNFHPAIELLIRYDSLGGKAHDLPLTECYLAWAATFAPDDVVVYQYGAYFFWKLAGDEATAESWFRQALFIAPQSAESHYNLGLLLFAMGRFDESREQAREAYALNYPLPGLRRKLERAGQWSADSAEPEAAPVM